MLMRIIPFLTILTFAYPTIKYKSLRTLTILINGTILHGILYDNIKMIYFDYIINLFIVLYTLSNHTQIMKSGLILSFLTTINILAWRYKYIKHRIIVDIIHSLICHIPGNLLIIQHLKKCKSIPDKT